MAFGVAQEAPMAQRLGIDRRDPFQNEALVEFMLGAPFDLSWRNGASKAIMRRTMRDRLPIVFLSKSRTGRLEPLFNAGIQAQREPLVNRVSDERLAPLTYVQAGRISALLSGDNHGKAALLSATIGYGLWHELHFASGFENTQKSKAQ
jgi:asparagine synthetase B (glutamine-hydrolysing)